MFSLFNDSTSKFINNHSIAVIATIDSNGYPHTSTIFYVTSGKDEIMFMSKSDTIKAINLNANKKAAITIIDAEKPKSVNLVGTAVLEKSSSKADSCIGAISKISSATLGKYAPILRMDKGSLVVFSFKPDKAVMNDFSSEDSKVKEEIKDY